jgi:hypothetical protein
MSRVTGNPLLARILARLPRHRHAQLYRNGFGKSLDHSQPLIRSGLKRCRWLILLLVVEKRILGFEKIIVPMRTSSEGIARGSQEGRGKLAKIAQLLWPRLVELWISLAIAVFFLIRVLGSHTSQSFLRAITRRHLP